MNKLDEKILTFFRNNCMKGYLTQIEEECVGLTDKAREAMLTVYKEQAEEKFNSAVFKNIIFENIVENLDEDDKLLYIDYLEKLANKLEPLVLEVTYKIEEAYDKGEFDQKEDKIGNKIVH